MSQVGLIRFGHTGIETKGVFDTDGVSYARPVQEIIPVDVRVRPREAGLMYTQGRVVSEVRPDRLQAGAIIDFYA